MDFNPCPEPFVHNSTLNLCYHFEDITGQTRTAANNNCKARHQRAHLIALETVEEYDFLKDYFLAGSSYAYLVTGGRTNNPGSTTDWFWEVEGNNTKRVTFFPWAPTEPNNGLGGTPEDILLIDPQYEFMDGPDDMSFFAGLCSICEYDP